MFNYQTKCERTFIISIEFSHTTCLSCPLDLQNISFQWNNFISHKCLPNDICIKNNGLLFLVKGKNEKQKRKRSAAFYAGLLFTYKTASRIIKKKNIIQTPFSVRCSGWVIEIYDNFILVFWLTKKSKSRIINNKLTKNKLNPKFILMDKFNISITNMVHYIFRSNKFCNSQRLFFSSTKF